MECELGINCSSVQFSSAAVNMPLETSGSVKTAYRQISNISFSQGSVATEIVAKLVAALLTAGLAESIGSLSWGL